MNPVFNLPVLISAIAVTLIAVAFFSWRSTAQLPKARRFLLLTLRILGVAGIAAILLNPGKWIKPQDETPNPWLILLDRSTSMNQPTGPETTRSSLSVSLAEQTLAAAEKNQIPVRLQPFTSSPLAPVDSTESLPALSAEGSDLHASLKRLLDEAAASGQSFAGILALSDGRQTATPTNAELAALTLRLRSRSIPFHAVPIGADTPSQDLVLRATRPTVTVFKGQKARIPFVIQSNNFPPQKTTIRLLDASNAEIASTELEIPSGKNVTSFFEIDAPQSTTRLSLETPVLPNESIAGNNLSPVTIRILNSKTRVFLAEGAPYWDSKFLAQLLRQQTQMDIQSVHRLSEERYFRIDTGNDEASETSTAIFPDSLDELSRFDLVVFGKNIDAFLTPARLEILRAYVRDRGGAVLFARGKPVTGTLPGLDALEPVTWSNASISEFRLRPVADGEAAGLFGEALPAPDASVWNLLPTLKDARQISLVKPFTRVLADGVTDGSNATSARFPALLVRRYGQGVTGLVNGDGLWKWDFYPEARELGNMYEDFWIQLIQWMASYSEFLPGQDFSLRLPSIRGNAGESVTASISFRGTQTPPNPILTITAPSGTTSEIQPGSFPDPSGHPNWRASFTPDSPGTWKLQIKDPRENAPPTPEANFTVPAPLKESDNLSPDPEFLEQLATATDGSLLTATSLESFLSSTFAPIPPSANTAGAIWQPSWLKWPLALLILLPLTAEWYIRRRQGLS